MAAKLPKIGVQAIVEGANQYFSDIGKVSTTTDNAAKSIQKSTKGLDGLTKLLDKFGGNFGRQISGVVQQAQGLNAELPAIASSLGGVNLAMVGVAAGAAAVAAAFVALGVRGAGLIGLQESFERLNRTIGQDSVAALNELRRASAGTISDFELMRLTNLALAGAGGEFGRQFGKDLPRLLEIARVQARATGQSVDFLFQSLITGIKRGSPLLIDNTGLVLKISAANEAMAASLGKSVEQLTAEEKQIAVLNATLEAGQTAITAFAGLQETNSDKMARAGVFITNSLDRLAVAVQPAFGAILDGINAVLGVIERFVNFISPAVTAITSFLAAFIATPLQAFAANLNAVGDALAPVFTFLSQIFDLAGTAMGRIVAPITQAFTAIGNTIGDSVKKIFFFLTGWREKDLGLDLDKLPQRLAYGAGQAFAAFGNAIIDVGNNLIFPAIISIATFIADFLVGESPPPRGPLSQIDKGGANVMMAWMEGFAGVGLQPVEEVAANVNAVLGDIGKFSMPQVEARLGQLDAALQPFNDQLAIVKANFDAINEPAKAALDSIHRQMGKALEALSTGAAGSAELVRSLDAQREKIENAIDGQQNLVDQAQIQQALAAAQQGEERTLLSIQQARLKASESMVGATDAVAKATKEATSAAAKGGAGAGIGGGEGALGLPTLDAATAGATENPLADSFNQGFDSTLNTAGLKQMQGSAVTLQKQLTRIGSADIGTRIADAFTGIGLSIGVKLQEASTTITEWIGGVTDPAREGSIPYAFNALAAGDWSALVQGLLLPFDNIGEGIATFLYNNFDPENLNSILGTLFLLPTRITNALSELGAVFDEAVFVPIENTITNVGLSIARFFVETGEGTLSGMIDAGVAWFTALPQRIFNAISSIGSVFFAAIATPVISALNVVIEGIESMINYALSALGTLIGSLQGVADAVGLGDQLAEIQASLVGGINLPRISMPSPPSPVMPAARAGGLFGVRVHRGEEVMGMGAGQKMAVFPRDVTRNLDLIASVLGQSMPLSLNGALAGGGSSNSTVNNTNNFSLPQPASSGNSVQMVATQMAMKRRSF